jgi:Mn-containing catalase
MEKLFRGTSPSSTGGELVTTQQPPEGAPFVPGPERPEEFAPGLTPELMELVEHVSKMQ